MSKDKKSSNKKIIICFIFVIALILLVLIFRDAIEEILFKELIGPGGLPDNKNYISPN